MKLVLGVNPGDFSQGSDAMVSDVVIFNRHLSEAEVVTVSEHLEAQPKRPVPCCFDMHVAVTKIA